MSMHAHKMIKSSQDDGFMRRTGHKLENLQHFRRYFPLYSDSSCMYMYINCTKFKRNCRAKCQTSSKASLVKFCSLFSNAEERILTLSVPLALPAVVLPS